MPKEEILRNIALLRREVRELQEEFLSFREEKLGFSELRGILSWDSPNSGAYCVVGDWIFSGKTRLSIYSFRRPFGNNKNNGSTNSSRNIPSVSSSGRS